MPNVTIQIPELLGNISHTIIRCHENAPLMISNKEISEKPDSQMNARFRICQGSFYHKDMVAL